VNAAKTTDGKTALSLATKPNVYVKVNPLAAAGAAGAAGGGGGGSAGPTVEVKNPLFSRPIKQRKSRKGRKARKARKARKNRKTRRN
jgi:hypothetical protein